jgi:uncharacterized protein (TIGR03067 family)
MSTDIPQKKDHTLVITLITILGSILVAFLSTYRNELAPIFFKSLTPTPTITVEAPESDQEKLQGVWIGREIGQDGEAKLTLIGNQVEFVDIYPQEWYKGIATLTEGVTQKEVDFLITDAPISEYVGKTAHGIYKFEGNTVLLSYTVPGIETRPTSFNVGDGNRVFIFTRQP